MAELFPITARTNLKALKTPKYRNTLRTPSEPSKSQFKLTRTCLGSSRSTGIELRRARRTSDSIVNDIF